ncbi:hypothetical protein pb186bvf_017746 [Paramecium bursaria]
MIQKCLHKLIMEEVDCAQLIWFLSQKFQLHSYYVFLLLQYLLGMFSDIIITFFNIRIKELEVLIRLFRNLYIYEQRNYSLEILRLAYKEAININDQNTKISFCFTQDEELDLLEKKQNWIIQ